MNSASTIDAWLTVLEKEIKDIVVSKHGVHLTEIERIIKGIVIYFSIKPMEIIWFKFKFCIFSLGFIEYNSYLDPLEGLITQILAEQESNLEYNREENALVAKIPLPPLSARTPAATARGRKGKLYLFNFIIISLFILLFVFYCSNNMYDILFINIT